jgi:hypothetical protein
MKEQQKTLFDDTQSDLKARVLRAVEGYCNSRKRAGLRKTPCRSVFDRRTRATGPENGTGKRLDGDIRQRGDKGVKSLSRCFSYIACQQHVFFPQFFAKRDF